MVIFPIVSRHSGNLARGYLAARIFEGTALVVGTIAVLSLLALSREFVVGGQIVFSLTALVLNFAVYRPRLVPRAISLWGLIGVPLALSGGLLVLFGVVADSSAIQTALTFPLAAQEMVFAIWLIVKRLNPSAIATQ